MTKQYRTLLRIAIGNLLLIPAAVPLAGEGSAPVLAALFCAVAAADQRVYRFLPGLAAGCFVSAASAGEAIPMLACLFIGATVCAALSQRSKWSAEAASALTAAACAFLMPVLSGDVLSAFSLLRAFLRAALALSLSPVFVTALKEKEASGDALRLSVSALAIGLLWGAADLHADAGLFLSALVTLTFGAAGAAAGALAGISTGVACLLAGLGAGPGMFFAMAGLFSGALSGMGAWASALAFAACLPALFFLAPEARAVCLFIAIPAYLIMPPRAIARITMLFFPRGREASLFSVRAAMRRLPAKGQTACGDSGLIRSLKDGRCVLLLSDGMGAGETAAKLSRRAVRVADGLLTEMKSENLAARAINRLLLDGDNEENYATLDMCLIDLTRGDACFRKFGSEPSWLYSGGKLTRVEGGALPAGVLCDAAARFTRVPLKNKDWIVMATDGAIYAAGGVEGFEKLLIERQDDATPDKWVADLFARIRLNERAHPDDASILCAQINRKRFVQSSLSQGS